MTIPNQLAQILRELVVSQRVRFFSRLDLKVIYSKPLSFTSGLLLGCFTFIPLKKLCIYIYTTHTFHDFLYTPHNFISSKTNVGVFFFRAQPTTAEAGTRSQSNRRNCRRWSHSVLGRGCWDQLSAPGDAPSSQGKGSLMLWNC